MTQSVRREPMFSIFLVCFVVGALTIGIATVTERFLLGSGETGVAQSPISIDPPQSTARDVKPAAAPTTKDVAELDIDPVMPANLRIPRLDIDTNVQHVGYTDDGRMDAPTEWEDVAWFRYGFLPGAPGNSVMAGHLDSTTGPAVFAGLYLMEPGDEIFVTGEDGDELTFVVTDVESVPAEEAPLDRIFGSSDTPQLNLITCEGHFDPDEEDYEHRLIVYTSLADS